MMGYSYLLVVFIVCAMWAGGVITGYTSHDPKSAHMLQEFLDQDQTNLIPFDREADFMCLQVQPRSTKQCREGRVRSLHVSDR